MSELIRYYNIILCSKMVVPTYHYYGIYVENRKNMYLNAGFQQ